MYDADLQGYFDSIPHDKLIAALRMRVVFHNEIGPDTRFKARLVRYADDFVVMARWMGPGIISFIERTLEQRMGLKLNREKSRIVKLREPRAALDFLGFTFRSDLDLKGRGHHYLFVGTSKKALARERAVLREKTSTKMCFRPIPDLIAELNKHLVGWKNYLDFRHGRRSLRQINSYVRARLTTHLRRRSQRRYRPPKGVTFYAHLDALGLVRL